MKMRFASLSLLTICLLAAVPASADEVLYTSGVYNGTSNSYNIGTAVVSDPFTVPGSSDIESLSIVYWDNKVEATLSSVDMAISSSQLPTGGFQTLTPIDNQLLGTNGYGYYLYKADFEFTSIDWSGAGWLTLKNATTTGSGTVLWDVNGTTKNSYDNAGGQTSIKGETFTLDGETPEPSSLLLLGTGLLGMAGMLRRKLAR